MPELRFSAWAPSNIALVKYMGKKDAGANLPENGSLSMTLDSLRTSVELVCGPARSGASGIRWVPEMPRSDVSGLLVPRLSEKGIDKLIRHVELVRAAAPAVFARHAVALAERGSEFWVFRTANTFPQGSGIASSASSFAALTLATAAACARDRAEFEKALRSRPELKFELARLSRQGSGSSCRSLAGPWVQWQGEEVSIVRSDLPKMSHFVVLVSSAEKRVSSSEAHLRVKTSPLWNGRVERAEARLKSMRDAIARGDLSTVARLAWSESWEMHSLFHTSATPFSYWEPGSISVLHALAPLIEEAHPPIVTMDAGPNVHVIVEESRAKEWEGRLGSLASELGVRLLRDRQGMGGDLS